MGKQVGPTPITAKLKRTTKGGIVQPQLKTLQSPAQKALVGKQHNLPDHLKAKIEAAPESPTKFIKPASYKKRIASGALEAAKHYQDARRSGWGGGLAAGFGFAKGFLSGKSDFGKSTSSNNKPSNKKAPSSNSTPKKGTYDYAKANRSDLDNIISKRNKAKKGSAEYNRYQNQINKAYGVGPTNRSTTEKTVQSPKPKAKTVSTTPKASTEIKPKSKTTKKAETSAKASELRSKGEKALAEGKTAKAQRLRKRYDRKTARDQRKAARKEKKSLVQNEISKLTSPNKNYKRGYYNKK